jgi:hypothetical protein
MTAFAVNDNREVLREITEDVRFDFVFFLLGIVARHLTAAVTPRLFDHSLLSEKIRAVHCAFFIRGFED